MPAGGGGGNYDDPPQRNLYDPDDTARGPYSQDSPPHNNYRDSPRNYQDSPRNYQDSPRNYPPQDSPRNYQDSPGNYRESPRNYDDYEHHPNHLTNGDDPLQQTTNDPYSGDPSVMPPRNMYGNEEPPYNDYSPQREPPLMAPPPEGYNPELMRRSPSIGSHGRGKHVAMDTGRFALIFSAVVFFSRSLFNH